MKGGRCLALVFSLTAGSGCVGEFATPEISAGGGAVEPPPSVGGIVSGGSRTPEATGGSAGGDLPGTGGAVGTPTPSASPVPLPTGPCAGGLALRRLNRYEYDNTVRDLLGDTSAPGRDLPADLVAAGFGNNAQALTVSPELIEKYEAISERLISEAWTRDTPGAGARLRVCAATDTACARQIISTFARRAWRRPPADADLGPYLGLYDTGRAQGEPFDAAVRLALKGVLLSPRFAFRVEGPGPTLDDHALASRLSYFLWSSMPDERLMGLAAASKLREPSTLQAEVRRMLSDNRALSLVQSFAGYWLELRMVNGITPAASFNFDPALKEDMRQETELFFTAFLREPRSALDMLSTDFTFLTSRLAKHYGLPDPKVTGPPKRVTVAADSHRGGLLTHGGLLAITSSSDRTAPVKRGHWVLTHLLCQEPPPAPDGVPPLPEPGSRPGRTLRQIAEEHRANPACAACHALMDPIGFGMENFDAVGAWRVQDRGLPIDPSGELNGVPFDGPRALADLLRKSPAFPRCLTEKVFVFAHGRQVEEAEAPLLQQITETFAASQHRLGELFAAVATHPSFARGCSAK